MLRLPKYLAQHRKDSNIFTVQSNCIISQAEDQIVTDHLKDLHNCTDAEKKQTKDNKHNHDNKEE